MRGNHNIQLQADSQHNLDGSQGCNEIELFDVGKKQIVVELEPIV
jgi:hypothetical protein